MKLWLCSLVLLAVCLNSFAGAVRADDGEKPSSPEPRTFSLQIDEYRLSEPIVLPEEDSEIIAKLKEQRKQGNLVSMETLRTSAIEDFEHLIHFGQQVAVTIGIQNAGNQRSNRITQDRTVGTLVKFRVSGSGEKLKIALNYESSFLVDHPIDNELTTSTTNVNRHETQLLVRLGEPVLVGGRSGVTTNYVVLTLF